MQERLVAEAIVGLRDTDDVLALSTARTGLREIACVRRTLDAVERALVLAARSERTSWATIASDLGVAKATALRRHRASDPVTAAREQARAADPWLQEIAAFRALARGEPLDRPL